MEELHKRIIETFFGVELKEGELIHRDESPKSGLSFWAGYSKSLRKSLERSSKITGYMFSHNGETPPDMDKSILDYMFTQLVISESEDNAIKAMKRIKRHRDWNMFEIDHVVVDNKDYTIVWD